MDRDMVIGTFIRLPRPRKDPGGHPNHWHISFQPVPGPSNKSVLFLVNPYSRVGHSAGTVDLEWCRTQIGREHMGRLWLLIMIRAFLRAEVGQLRPWSWSTDCATMNDVIKIALDQFGIANVLPKLHRSGEHEINVATDVYQHHFASLQ